MSKFVISVVVMVMVSLVIVPAMAEQTYRVVAVVVSYETTSFGDFEVNVIDAEGNIWAYYADEAHIGDLVILEVFDFEGYEYDEIIDVVTVSRLDDLEMVQWLIH